MKTVNILGTPYTIHVKRYADEEAFERRSCAGLCNRYSKEIVLCDMHTYDGWEHETEKTIDAAQKQYLRHEIVHAFIRESGLLDNALDYDGPWCANEELVDWIALQGPKIYKAWEEAGCLD